MNGFRVWDGDGSLDTHGAGCSGYKGTVNMERGSNGTGG